MAKQAEAERTRRAKIIHAEGESQAAQMLVEAARSPCEAGPSRAAAALPADPRRHRAREDADRRLPAADGSDQAVRSARDVNSARTLALRGRAARAGDGMRRLRRACAQGPPVAGAPAAVGDRGALPVLAVPRACWAWDLRCATSMTARCASAGAAHRRRYGAVSPEACMRWRFGGPRLVGRTDPARRTRLDRGLAAVCLGGMALTSHQKERHVGTDRCRRSARGGAVAAANPQGSAPAESPHAKIGALGMDLTGRDPSVKPGDDFYPTPTGTGRRRARSRPTAARWGSFEMLRERPPSSCWKSCDGLPAGAPDGSNQQKLYDYYHSYLDTAAIDQLRSCAGARRPRCDRRRRRLTRTWRGCWSGRPAPDVPARSGITADRRIRPLRVVMSPRAAWGCRTATTI